MRIKFELQFHLPLPLMRGNTYCICYTRVRKTGRYTVPQTGVKAGTLFQRTCHRAKGVYALSSTPDGRLLAGLNGKGAYLLKQSKHKFINKMTVRYT